MKGLRPVFSHSDRCLEYAVNYLFDAEQLARNDWFFSLAQQFFFAAAWSQERRAHFISTWRWTLPPQRCYGHMAVRATAYFNSSTLSAREFFISRCYLAMSRITESFLRCGVF